ncbi:hypothetical protein CSB07_01320 [Candidatus Gracilibacteria bacterium]|nr:MAG: hypothetical protein CSB07_01320 [Candidatus Gracilibacteria bacterium]PIE85080.1 MAG: hypothetical protein CSA08_04015 [Candidatus Gracilibacteria bacterium]
MIEIFIPTEIKGYLEVNCFSKKLENILKNTFFGIIIKDFESAYFLGKYIYLKNFDEDLIIFCNGEFGKNYFLDFDFSKYNIGYLGTKILSENDIGNNVNDIDKKILKIITDLKSNKLLTNSKKDLIIKEIKNIFFGLSGISFLLVSLREKSISNIDELSQIKGKIDLESQATLLKETSKTKILELDLFIKKLDNKLNLFINTIKEHLKNSTSRKK